MNPTSSPKYIRPRKPLNKVFGLRRRRSWSVLSYSPQRGRRICLFRKNYCEPAGPFFSALRFQKTTKIPPMFKEHTHTHTRSAFGAGILPGLSDSRVRNHGGNRLQRDPMKCLPLTATLDKQQITFPHTKLCRFTIGGKPNMTGEPPICNT